MPSLFIIVNEDRFFLSHRKEIAVHAIKNGYDVTVVAKDTGRITEVEALGLKTIKLPINPTGTNVLEELRTFYFLYCLYKREKPDIVHHVGLKNILWGGLAARFARVKGVLNAVSGLGIMFDSVNLSKLSKAILYTIRFACNRNNVAILFQNNEDRKLFESHRILDKCNIYFTRGSGVDLNYYNYVKPPTNDVIRVIFTARMVEEKGVKVLIEAAELLRKDYNNKVVFLLCGDLSHNPRAIKASYIMNHCDGKYICWLGYRSDIKDLLEGSDIMCFPSYYREGVPKSLIEAAAIGRPIVTTNSIGCKDVVIDGYNGFLVPIKNSLELANKLRVLFADANKRKIMGINSRKLAEKYFSLESVIETHMTIYKNLLYQD